MVSGFRGVYEQPDRQFSSRVHVRNVGPETLGFFPSAEAAAAAYAQRQARPRNCFVRPAKSFWEPVAPITEAFALLEMCTRVRFCDDIQCGFGFF